jgi:YgiT-type zinc finger domain-containing protein
MFHCDICGSTEAQQKLVTEMFEIDGQRILVEKIPASTCVQCGELTFSRETTEKIRRMVRNKVDLVGTVQLDLFTYRPIVHAASG